LAAVGAVARFSTGQHDEEGNEICRYELRAQAFISSDTNRDLVREPFASWIRTGRLTVSPNELVDVRRVVQEWQRQYNVTEWAYDPHNSRDLAQSMETEGITAVAFYQNCGMYNEPLRTFLAGLRRGQIRHGGDSLLTWCAGNVVLKANARNEWMPDKRASSEKIDAFVACLMAYRLATLAKSRPTGNLYLV
jgi:phage terminase large subunit-like protein